MKRYRLRIPAITTAWIEQEADSKSDAISKVVERINSKTVDYSPEDLWEVDEIHPQEATE